jgi:hypothetical protein
MTDIESDIKEAMMHHPSRLELYYKSSEDKSSQTDKIISYEMKQREN